MGCVFKFANLGLFSVQTGNSYIRCYLSHRAKGIETLSFPYFQKAVGLKAHLKCNKQPLCRPREGAALRQVGRVSATWGRHWGASTGCCSQCAGQGRKRCLCASPPSQKNFRACPFSCNSPCNNTRVAKVFWKPPRHCLDSIWWHQCAHWWEWLFWRSSTPLPSSLYSSTLLSLLLSNSVLPQSFLMGVYKTKTPRFQQSGITQLFYNP